MKRLALEWIFTIALIVGSLLLIGWMCSQVCCGQDVRDPLPNPATVGRPRVFNRPPERGGAPHVLVYGVSWCSNCNGIMDELRRNAELRTTDSQGVECVRVHGTWFWLYVMDEPRWDGCQRPPEVPEIVYRDARRRIIDKAYGYNPGDREAFISIVSRANPRRDQ
jgi:hypothetical protein